MKYIIAFAISTLLFCGCATTDTEKGDVSALSTTNAVIETGSKFVLEDIPAGLNDIIIPDTNSVLKLENIVDIALNNNLNTHAAWENLKISESRKSQADSYFYPTLEVDADITKQYADANIDSADSELVKYGPGASLSWLIFDFGGRSAGSSYAGLLLDAQLANYNQAIQDVLFDAISGYFSYNSAVETLASIEIDITNAVTTVEAARTRKKANLGTELDVLNAQSKLEQILYDKASAESELKNTYANLAYVLGLPANIDFSVASFEKDSSSVTNLSVNVDQLIELALKQRSDLQSLEYERMASEKNIEVVASDLYPSVSLGADAAYDWYDVDKGITINGLEDELSYSALVKLNWQVFDGFLDVSRRREAIYQMENAQTVYEEGKLSVVADVWNKYYQFKAAAKQLKASTAYFNSSSQAYALASKSYKNGLISLLDLLESQSDLSEARRQEINSRNSLFISVAALAHATGKLSEQNDLLSNLTERKK